MGLNWRAWLGRLPEPDLRRPRVLAVLAVAALTVAVGGFLLGTLAGSAQAERSALAEVRDWAAQLAQQRQAIATTRAVLGEQVGALAGGADARPPDAPRCTGQAPH